MYTDSVKSLSDYDGRFLPKWALDPSIAYWQGTAQMEAFLSGIGETVVRHEERATYTATYTASGFLVSSSGYVKRANDGRMSELKQWRAK